MAFLKGILSKLNGSAGSLTFKQVNGKTLVSEKATTVRSVDATVDKVGSGTYGKNLITILISSYVTSSGQRDFMVAKPPSVPVADITLRMMSMCFCVTMSSSLSCPVST